MRWRLPCKPLHTLASKQSGVECYHLLIIMLPSNNEHLFIHLRICWSAVVHEYGHMLGLDVVQRDMQLPRQNCQGVAIDAGDHAATQLRDCSLPATLRADSACRS